MKNILTILILCAWAQTIAAQKVIEKNFDFSQKKMVAMDIQIADSITIITWNKNEVYVKASVNVNDNKNNEDYKVSFDESGEAVSIRSKFEFAKGRNCCGDSGNCNCNCNCNSRITYEVYMPENAGFSVETINGNISISGKTASRIRAHSISGFIDLTVAPDTKADLKMNTISGTMYTNFDFQKERNLRHVGGSSISTNLNGGGERKIDLETISGDIFFRKQS
jgi:hypothetical protein